MTRRAGGTLVIEAEKSAKCAYCKRERELRPYGKNGASICFECAMSTPENKAEAEQQFGRRLGVD